MCVCVVFTEIHANSGKSKFNFNNLNYFVPISLDWAFVMWVFK